MDEWHFSAFPNQFLVVALQTASSSAPRLLALDTVMAALPSGTHGAPQL